MKSFICTLAEDNIGKKRKRNAKHNLIALSIIFNSFYSTSNKTNVNTVHNINTKQKTTFFPSS